MVEYKNKNKTKQKIIITTNLLQWLKTNSKIIIITIKKGKIYHLDIMVEPFNPS